MFDFVIIGGGVSGLFAAMRIETKLPHARILLLEKNSYLGGRTRMDTFHSHKVVTGAGVGRFPKDILLRQLVGECQEIKPVESKICYQFPQPVYTLTYIENLKKKKPRSRDRGSKRKGKIPENEVRSRSSTALGF